MRKTACRGAAVILMAVMMLAILSGCAKSKVKHTISEFESACQAVDAAGMLACIDPTISKPLQDAMDLLGIENTSGLFDELVEILNLFEGTGEAAEELVQSIRIEPVSYEFNDSSDKCSVAARISCGGDSAENVVIKLVLKDDVWYISGIGG